MAEKKRPDLMVKTDDQLAMALQELKREQFNLRFQAATGQLEKPDRIRKVRRAAEMAKQHSTVTSSDGMSVTVRSAGRGRNATTVFGNITVSGKKPNAELIKLHVARSTQALERVGAKLMTPGVRLSTKKGVPRYSADENRPSIIIRSLNGQITTGRLVNGQFVETE